MDGMNVLLHTGLYSLHTNGYMEFSPIEIPLGTRQACALLTMQITYVLMNITNIIACWWPWCIITKTKRPQNII